MKKVWSVILCASLLLLSFGAMLSCTQEREQRREDGSLYLEGTYIPSGGIGDKVFVFTSELLVMVQVINEETVEFHYDYRIEEGDDEMTLILTYKNHVYNGRSAEVMFYLNGMQAEYKKNPTLESTLDIGEGYIVVSGQKLVQKTEADT